jgi:hypothetical protein
MKATTKDAENWLRVWGMIQAGRNPDRMTPREIYERRAEAQAQEEASRATRRVSEHFDVMDVACGYGPPPLPFESPYAAPKVNVGTVRTASDPDVRMWVFIEVEKVLNDIPGAWSFAYHKWAEGKAAKEFRNAAWKTEEGAYTLTWRIKTAMRDRIGTVPDNVSAEVKRRVQQIIREMEAA